MVNCLYVAPNGNDCNEGTLEKPLATLKGARDAVRRIKPSWQTGDITVYFRGGQYTLKEPVVFEPEDSGSNGFSVHYMAYEKEEPVFSGGVGVTGWEPWEGRAGIFCAPFKTGRKLRQLYVNGQRAQMAEGKHFFYQDITSMYGEITVTGDEPWAYTSGTAVAGMEVPKAYLPAIRRPADVEVCGKAGFGYHQLEIVDVLEREDTCVAVFAQPAGAIVQSVPVEFGCGFLSNMPELNAVSEYCFRNALEFLDTPGEFYYDRLDGVIYYYPRPDEDMATAEVVAPLSDGLVRIAGRSVDERVHDLSFSGLTFAYSHWSMMKFGDHHADTATQAVSMYAYYAPHGSMHNSKYGILRTQGAAVQVDNAENIVFEKNGIRHTGAIGIAFGNDVCHSRIDRNVIRDIGSSAIVIGDARHVYIGDGDFPAGVEGLCEHITIHKNIMKDLSVLSLQAPGITMIYGRHIDITGNFMENSAYTGISLGWGWVDFSSHCCDKPSQSLGYNRICDNVLINTCNRMHDGAAIYTLAEQPHSEIAGNIVSGVGGFSEASAIYLDQGSAYFDIHDNTYLGQKGGWFWVWGNEAQVYHCHVHNNAATRRIEHPVVGENDVESRLHESVCEYARKV